MFCVAVFVANDALKDFNEMICAQILARGSVSFFMRKKFLLMIDLKFVDILQTLRLVRLDSKIRETIVKSGSRYNSTQEQMKGRMRKKLYSQRPAEHSVKVCWGGDDKETKTRMYVKIS